MSEKTIKQLACVSPQKQLNEGMIMTKKPVRLNMRSKTLLTSAVALTFVLSIMVGSYFITEMDFISDLSIKNLSPSFAHPFGTDWLGRDMFMRTIKGLSLSLSVGTISSVSSVFIAFVFAMVMAMFRNKAGAVVSYLIDLFLSLPHIVLLILISFALGGGKRGIIIGLMLTHWPNLTRLLRTEILQMQNASYIDMAKGFGKSPFFIATKHILPHLIPQFFVGLVLLFPHAVLHEASITFLGFGLPPDQPAIGVILSESMQYLSTGMWWLSFFPGFLLFLVVWAAQVIGNNVKKLIDPHGAHE